ncbi:cutinase-domain-containing protein [Cladorrhinum samala]|uniref:Cutinase n=1 Tax=Cladorrhinum samala TaxID=585594 RepID=A0AAV9HZQ9_9PEZI|nr:cutinase-domain-containing protein [Cladorrhinum samala]
MKFLSIIAALASAVSALPAEDIRARELVESHAQSMALVKPRAWSALLGTATELETGGACPGVIFIFARGSTETGNLVSLATFPLHLTFGTLGVPIGRALESALGASNVWVQGVGGPYTAGLLDNTLPEGTTTAAINEMKRLFTRANTLCPQAKIVAGGYSQGAALAGAAVRDSSAAIREQIKGVVLFGWTKNLQNLGKIPNYPADRLEVFCAIGDLVCTGSLIVTPAHLTYGDEADNEAPRFLLSKL